MDRTMSGLVVERQLFSGTDEYMYVLKTKTYLLIDKKFDSVIHSGYIALALAKALKEYADCSAFNSDVLTGVANTR